MSETALFTWPPRYLRLPRARSIPRNSRDPCLLSCLDAHQFHRQHHVQLDPQQCTRLIVTARFRPGAHPTPSPPVLATGRLDPPQQRRYLGGRYSTAAHLGQRAVAPSPRVPGQATVRTRATRRYVPAPQASAKPPPLGTQWRA